MTRINTIDPVDLLDQHLMAEYRELPRAFHKADLSRPGLPSTYRMGKGHVLFFYNKPSWLAARHRAIVVELQARGFRLTSRDPLSSSKGVAWQPGPADHRVNLARLDERLRAKPGFYRLRGNPVDSDYYGRLLRRFR